MFNLKARHDHSKSEVARIVQSVNSKKESAVLDLACGAGHHCRAFAELGLKVTGLDCSSAYLRAARQFHGNKHNPIKYVQGDMRRLRLRFGSERFDLVTSLNNSFGYCTRRTDDFAVLRQIHSVLKPGGALVINTLNASKLRSTKEFAPTVRQPLRDLFIIDAVQFRPKEKSLLIVWTVIDQRRSPSRPYTLSMQQNTYTHEELIGQLVSAGFGIEKVWSWLRGGDFEPRRSQHQTILARKENNHKPA
ncbi:class I SAM-dependent methyltransferase [Bradyrhizobium brasilense]|uniref:class I SAM-dependent methyltransferase n=1 Tax=Bradyrhizobium brasilense TaxID=1419277 RepID=UPI001E4FC425|nr:class I SAM-dependent methyltransferase [Bradyrhizobium brasilense]MCC8971584.1 class I SAM-dependent methyltransferase [Bradyrhizobium brasilense]